MRQLKVPVVMLAGVLMAEIAFARAVACNKAQTRCVTRDKNLTIGDSVLILNQRDEIVASGRVKSIRGEKRSLAITKRHGLIAETDRVHLLQESTERGSNVDFKVYQEPASYTLGVSIDYGFVSIADSAPGFAITPYGTWRLKKGLELVGRGLYSSYSATLSSTSGPQVDPLPFELRQLGLLTGLGYRMLESQDLSFRGEIAFGLAQVAATVDGDADLSDQQFHAKTKVKNGRSSIARWSIGAYYHVGRILLNLDVAQSLTGKALSSGISTGAAYEFP